MRKKYDWNSIKAEFVTGDITAAELAKKHKISYGTLYRHYQIERWSDAKKEYLENVIEKCADNAAYIAAMRLAKEIDIANKLSGVLNEAVSDKRQFNRYIVKTKDETGNPLMEEMIFDKVDMDSLNSAIKALKSLEEIKRVMYAIISPDETKKDESNEKNETGVVMLPEIEEENNES